MAMNIKILISLAIGFTLSIFPELMMAETMAVNPAINQSLKVNRPLPSIPSPPALDVKAYVLMDADSGYVIAEANSNERLSIASLTKLATLYVVAESLKVSNIKLDSLTLVSEKAWRTGGSKMFIEVNKKVSLEDLIMGLVVASGNDATITLAEYFGGTEESFVEQMNQVATSLVLENTKFVDSTGLSDDNYSSALDMALLAKAWINNFPEYYPWFKEKWMVFNGIKQPNRNRLLWSDESVDGLKTGHTNEAGYCLAVSARRGDTRLIAVVLGSKSEALRAMQSEALLNYGFRFYETNKVLAGGVVLNNVQTFYGKKNSTPIGLAEDVYVTVPIGKYPDVKAKVLIEGYLNAPIRRGEVCAKLEVSLGEKVIALKPLVALQDNLRTNPVGVVFDYLKKILYGLCHKK